ncbi:sulfite exporter TauE/SafE family protein [Aquabacterium sp. OR-4]|uniref:sulfite exporter TauE/SafE family protein n=1 Tax=Aquabacterium sp. OR-4 TaxID=2978127 RepID=UPI0028C67582|nr:sulfite exporter TauE/SafE family protein [Aquabacterium sp. OR-4]MDT7838155.1 sulfite exporter TauE/SafE family protein [Aquabacterium sp. OR-4]
MDLLTSHGPWWLAGLAVALVATGLLAGVLAGLLGVGGGIVIVPVLFHLFSLLGVDPSVRMHVAVGTSLATIIPTSLMSSRAHRRRGSLDPALIRRLLPGVLLGVATGAVASRYLAGPWLTAVFGVVALVVAVQMGFKREGSAWRDGLPGPAATAGIGAGIGGLSTLMGIGGGTLGVPILANLKVPMHTAVGTGALLGTVISIPGAAAFLVNGLGVPLRPPFSLGHVNLLGAALIVPATMLSTKWGAALAHRIDARRLRQVFAAFLALTAARMLLSLWH